MVAVDGVALLAEGVDRNFLAQCLLEPVDVALLAEGVDRNISVKPEDFRLHVALLAEGVDRNYFNAESASKHNKSPSSRRAWIEINIETSFYQGTQVALLAEGVDRNSIASRSATSCCSRPPRGGRG